MKTTVFPRMAALLVLGTVTPLLAQNSVSTPRSFEIDSKADNLDGSADTSYISSSTLIGRFEVPVTEKAQGSLKTSKPVYASQDALTLNPRLSGSQNVESVVDLNVLRNPSPYRKIAVSTSGLKPYEVSTNSLQSGLARISAIYRETGKREKTSDCQTVSLSAEQRIKIDTSRVLEIVESEIGANPSCACEIVKSAITATDADVKMVVAIVETSINAAPESMRIISQCAIASRPESINAVQALLAKIDPNSGDSEVYSSKSSKSAKSAKVAAVISTPPPDPLDRFYFPVIPPILTNVVTEVNPRNRRGY